MNREPTIAILCERFCAQHEASQARRELMGAMLRHAASAFGSVRASEVTAAQLAAWRASLPPPTRWQATQALKQVTAWSAAWQLIDRDYLAAVANPRPRTREHRPLTSWNDVRRLSTALPPRLALLPWLGAGCGLRPGELLGLDWRSIDLGRRELQVVASCWRGELRGELKTARSRRVVPIRELVAQQLAQHAPTSGRGLVFTGRTGAALDLHNLRARAWKPAVRAAGLEHVHRLYDLRHTYATWSLRAGVSIFQLARRMGTSVDMIDLTYGHLAADAGDHERSQLDQWDRLYD